MKKTSSWLLMSTAAAVLAVQTPAQAASVEDRLQRLERMADNPVLLQLRQRIEEQQQEIQVLQDQIDRLTRNQRFAIQQATKRYAETDERLSKLESKPATTFAPASPVVPVSPVVPPSITSPSFTSSSQGNSNDAASKVSSEEATNATATASVVIQTRPATAEENTAYQKAFALMRAAKYDESIKAFERFLADYPTSKLASNASYWAGEGYLIGKAYTKALHSFERVLNTYPDSSKVPDAMLRAADSLKSMQQKDKARELYQQVMDKYPDTRAASSAKKRIN